MQTTRKYLYSVSPKFCNTKRRASLMPVVQMMKVDSAASSFNLITFLIVHIMAMLYYFIFHYFIYVSFAWMRSSKCLSYLGSDFWALEYRSPQRTNTPLSYIVQYMATHIHAKAFVGSQGGTIPYKTFPNYYIFHTKIDTKHRKQILLSNSALFREVNLCLRRQMASFLFSSCKLVR